MTQKYDVIVIGAGHNGLVNAAYLAKAGLYVLVLERRNNLGGAAATEEIFPGFQVNTGAVDAGLFKQRIVTDLELEKNGLEFLQSEVAVFAPQSDGRALTLWRDPERSLDEISRFSAIDGKKYLAFLKQTESAGAFLAEVFDKLPPDLTRHSPGELWPWLKTGFRFRRSGRKELMEIMRVFPLPVKDFLDEWFESEPLKGALGQPAVIGGMPGSYASGTTLMYLYQQMGEKNGGYRSSRSVKGGIGRLSQAIAESATKNGAIIQSGEPIQQIIVQEDQVLGVRLGSGDVIESRMVVSSLDPRRTFFDLVGGSNLMPGFIRDVRNIRYKGTTAKVNLVLNGLPEFKGLEGEKQLSGYIVISPSLEYLERAWDDAKYGRISNSPVLEATIPTLLDPALAPPGKHIMSITVQYAPYHLQSGSWQTRRESLGELVVSTLSKYAANFPEIVQQRQVLTPLDLERDYGLTEGSIFHGRMELDQLLFMRPIAGFSRYRTPFKGLYLCGAGSHPGGGVTGAPGYFAAREILRDWN